MPRTSFNDGWTVRPKTSIFAQLGGQTEPARPVALPHDAQFMMERGTAGEGGHNAYFPSGAFEYIKQIEAPELWRDKRVTVEFEGVYRDAMVYVNGDFVAQRPNGYTTLKVALDPYLRYGQTNTIRVDARAHRDSRWYSGIGIHRDTWLTVTEPIHIETVQVTTPDIDTDRAIVLISSVVKNQSMHTETVALESVILGPDGARVTGDSSPVTVRAGQSATVRQRLLVREPRLWNVDAPNLYAVASVLSRSTTGPEERTTTFGIRRLQVDPERGLRINGIPIKLRGACIHHDNGLLGAAAIGRAEERRVETLKAAGFNAIRSSHNPISSAMLDACDRLGMLVMDETFDMWAEGKTEFDYSLAFPEWWERDIESMVAKDINHPSVIFYSIGNEIPETGTALGAELGRRLAEKVRALDPNRLVTNGINGFVSVLPQVLEMMKDTNVFGGGGVNEAMGTGAEEFMNQVSSSPDVSQRTAESFSVLDVAGINYGEARYELDAALFPHRVIVGTETFPRAIDRNWRLVQQLPHVIGDFTWTGWDYLGEVGIGRVHYAGEEIKAFEAPYPWLSAWCGDIDITGYRRPQSYYREIVWGLRHTPYIAVARPETVERTPALGQWSWTDALSSWTWDVPAGAPMAVEVYSDAVEIELLLNGTSMGRAPAGPGNRFTARFTISYVPGRLEAVAYDADGVETGRSELVAARKARLTAFADRHRLTYDHRDLAFVSIELRDADGILATSASADVTVTVEGAGELHALGSARPDNAERFDQDSHRTFDGRLLAAVRPTGLGDIRVLVSAPRLEPVEVILHVAASAVTTALVDA